MDQSLFLQACAVSIFLMIPAAYSAEKISLSPRALRILLLASTTVVFLFFATNTHVALGEIWTLVRTGEVVEQTGTAFAVQPPVPTKGTAATETKQSITKKDDAPPAGEEVGKGGEERNKGKVEEEQPLGTSHDEAANPPPSAATPTTTSPEDHQAASPPPTRPSLFTISGIRAFCIGLKHIAQGHFFGVVFLISFVYLTLQAFCIPGTAALNAALGALFGTAFGLPVGVALGTLGASLCYGLSTLFGVRLVESVDHLLMNDKGLSKIRSQVHRNRSELLAYMLFLRLTPVLPNWLVNLASPVVHVPFRTFALATCLGISPQTYLTVRFGSMVSDAAATGGDVKSIVTVYDTIFLCLVGITVVVISRLKKKFGGGAATLGGHVHAAEN